MARRRRYDTEALVGQLKAERRTGILLSLLGVCILFLLVGLYIAGGGDDDIPTVPGGAEAATDAETNPEAGTAGEGQAEVTGAAQAAPAGEAGGGQQEEEVPAEKADVGPASLRIMLSRKGVVWLDNEKLGKFKKRNIEVPPGKHVLRAKFGKKKVEQEIEVDGGKTYGIYVDKKKKKVFIKPK